MRFILLASFVGEKPKPLSNTFAGETFEDCLRKITPVLTYRTIEPFRVYYLIEGRDDEGNLIAFAEIRVGLEWAGREGACNAL